MSNQHSVNKFKPTDIKPNPYNQHQITAQTKFISTHKQSITIKLIHPKQQTHRKAKHKHQIK